MKYRYQIYVPYGKLWIGLESSKYTNLQEAEEEFDSWNGKVGIPIRLYDLKKKKFIRQ